MAPPRTVWRTHVENPHVSNSLCTFSEVSCWKIQRAERFSEMVAMEKKSREKYLINTTILLSIINNQAQWICAEWLWDKVSGGSFCTDLLTKKKILHFDKWQTNGAWKHALQTAITSRAPAEDLHAEHIQFSCAQCAVHLPKNTSKLLKQISSAERWCSVSKMQCSWHKSRKKFQQGCPRKTPKWGW